MPLLPAQDFNIDDALQKYISTVEFALSYPPSSREELQKEIDAIVLFIKFTYGSKTRNAFEEIIDYEKPIDVLLRSIKAFLLALKARSNNKTFLENHYADNNIEQAGSNPSSIFIVHGHDNELKETVARYVEKLGLKAIILNEQTNRGKTIIEKFEEFAGESSFAIVLLTPDDIVSSRSNTRVKRFRARQNVIYELGFFNGKLGRKRVCALYRNDAKGEIELPSDFLGVVYVPVDKSGAWKIHLAKEMKDVGLRIDLEKAL